MARKPPRYDLPSAAPEPLAEVQRFINTVDVGRQSDWLGDFLAERGFFFETQEQLSQARAIREAFRGLLTATNKSEASTSIGLLDAVATGARLSVEFAAPRLVSRARGLEGYLGGLVAASFMAMHDGSWERLKCCRNDDCRWAFYDYSKNRSATWCSMKICGNRTKTRAYRRREQAA
jgi:predicted RNA-binding Zn ribbon-like protein